MCYIPDMLASVARLHTSISLQSISHNAKHDRHGILVPCSQSSYVQGCAWRFRCLTSVLHQGWTQHNHRHIWVTDGILVWFAVASLCLKHLAFVGVVAARHTLRGEEAACMHLTFFLTIQDVITRVQSLEKMGQLSGVMDDRGKVLTLLLVFSAYWVVGLLAADRLFMCMSWNTLMA